MTKSHVTEQMSQCDITQMKSYDNCGKVMHRPCSNCINSVQEIHENSIKFFLLSADKGAVGFILAQELAILTEYRKKELAILFSFWSIFILTSECDNIIM